MENIFLDWAEFKSSLTLKRSPLQFKETTKYVEPFFIDGNIIYYSLLWKGIFASGISSTNDADLLDFETNYRNAPKTGTAMNPRDTSGNLISTKYAYDYSEENGTFEGTGMVIAVAGSQTFYDFPVTTQLYVQGGTIWVQGSTLGDVADFSVVDKTDVLGLFSTYGLSVANNDVLELRKYVKNFAVPPWNALFQIKMSTAASVAAGLFLRSSYTSVGTADANFSINYEVFENG